MKYQVAFSPGQFCVLKIENDSMKPIATFILREDAELFKIAKEFGAFMGDNSPISPVGMSSDQYEDAIHPDVTLGE